MPFISIHHYHHEAPDVQLHQRLDWMYSQAERILTALEQVISNQGLIMATIQDIIDTVTAEKGKIASLETLIDQLHQQITGLTSGNLPADVQAKVDKAFADAKANSGELDKALSANAPSTGSASSSGSTTPAVSSPSVPPSTVSPTPVVPSPTPPASTITQPAPTP